MYRRGKRSWIKHLDFTLLDILCLELAFLVAYLIRMKSGLRLNDELLDDGLYGSLAVFILVLDIFVVFFSDPYNGILRRNKYQELRATLLHCLLNFGCILVYFYATQKSLDYSRTLIFLYLGFSMVFMYTARVLWKRLIRYRKLNDVNKSEMLVVCEDYNAVRCLHELSTNRYTDFKIIGAVVVDKDRTGETIEGIPVVSNADGFLNYVRENVVDEVFIDGNTRSSSEALAQELIELGVTVHTSLVYSDRLLMNTVVERYASYTVLTSSMKMQTLRQAFFKRFFDILGALVGLVFTGIAILIFAPIIKHQSPGPIFYKSTRIGRNGRRFTFYKFRTMHVGADKLQESLAAENEMQGNMFKMENDPRVFPIGHFMRKHSIDELPQFYNVLIGDMSLVGTRPPTEAEFEKYEYHHKARLAIKPGLTGMWQVSGRSDITDFEEVVALDTEYIQNFSLALDAKIIFKTIGVVFNGKGGK
ncbi:MAG: sugar transferase [Lachnospiraceae bacterium]|nr:sugar transferase [Lachnospiraceae bacterium]